MVSVCVREGTSLNLQDLGMVITQNMQLRGAVCGQRDLTPRLLCVRMVLRWGKAEVPKIEQISMVTEIIGACFFLFLSLRTVRIVILYRWLEVTDYFPLHCIQGFTKLNSYIKYQLL